MTTITLMSGGHVGDPLSPVAVSGNPTNINCTFTITGPPANFAGATIFGTVDGQNYLPILQMQIDPQGPNSVTAAVSDPGQYVGYDALMNYVSPGGYTGTVTMSY